MSFQSFIDFQEKTNPDKYWKIKDTQVVNLQTGNYWFIKKYIVYYINFYINRGSINKNTLIETYNNFNKFIQSIEDDLMKKKAELFFLGDFNPDKIITFSKFSNMGTKYDHDARSMYVQRLMGTGGQQGIMSYIKQLLNENKTLSEIIELVEIKKDYYIKNNISGKKNKIEILEKDKKKIIHQIVDPKGKKIPIDRTLDDYYASFTRNTRQVYSKLGFLPPNADGIAYNQISKLIFDSQNEVELNTICEHQKIKYRIGNPLTDDMINYNKKDNLKLIKKYALEKNACEDFYVSPYIALMDLLEKIINDKDLDDYISLNEYQSIISKIAPFDVDTCIKLIKDFRKNNHSTLENRTKKRQITDKPVSGGFQKPLSYLFYGYITKKNIKGDLRQFNNRAFIEILSNGIYKIIDKENFFEYYKKLNSIKEYLNKKYNRLYKNISEDYQSKLANEYSTAFSKNEDLKNVNINKKYEFSDLDKIGDYLQSWSYYIQTIDIQLFNKILELNKTVYPFDYFHKILGKQSELNQKENINNILSNDVIESLATRSGYTFYNNNSLIKDRKEFNKIKNKIKKDREQGRYKDKKYVFDPSSCDSCGSNQFKLDCHHIIPHRIGGPDVDLNLTFLCKNCHDSFTFLNKEKTIENSDNRDTVIQLLRLKGFFTFDHVIKMINQNLIKILHLDYLFNDRYITFSERLELRKKLFERQKTSEKNEITSARFTKEINKRWGRLMKEVYLFRINQNYVFGNYRFDYSINECDGKCGNSITDYCECHHIIPKIGSLSGNFKKEYGSNPLNGPENEFNYLFLCKNCHLEFTNHTEKRKKIVKRIKEENLFNYLSVLKLITSSDIDLKQINFLHKEGFIDVDIYNYIKRDLEIMKRYQ